MTPYLSHFTTSLFITYRRKWTSPGGDVTVHSPDDLPLPLCFSFTIQALTVFFFFIPPLKLLQLEPTNDQHVQSPERSTGRGRKYESQSASAALFPCAMLYRSLLQIFCFCCMPDVLMKLMQGPRPPSGILRDKQEGEDR